MGKTLVIGLDFGTDSVRALIVDASSGQEMSSSSAMYPRWSQGFYCDPAKSAFRQHPLDYIESMEACIKDALKVLPKGSLEKIAAIGVDTTGSTPCAIDEHAQPIALKPEYSDMPDAMFYLWKDHSSSNEAARINDVIDGGRQVDYRKFTGGRYSEEWFWAKALNVLASGRLDNGRIASFIELCDWVPALLTGVKSHRLIKRGRCAAGHKGMWNKQWGGYPSASFLGSLDERLGKIRTEIDDTTYTPEAAAGRISSEWAAKLGLDDDVIIGIGSIDAHVGAVGVGIKEGTLVKIMGTSSCDIMVADNSTLDGIGAIDISGQVDGSVLPHMVGLEAGQASFGDSFAWFADLLEWGRNDSDRKEFYRAISEAADRIGPNEAAPVFIDWLNGRRSPDTNLSLKGAFTCLSLSSSAPQLYRSISEGLAFGSRRIVETITGYGIPIRDVIATGSVAKKSGLAMQVMSDVLNMPILVASSEQTCALGAAMLSAVASGLCRDVKEAQDRMGQGFEKKYEPRQEMAKIYDKLYDKYCKVAGKLETI